MTPCPPHSSPAFAGFTQNSEASGGVVGSFDLLCLSGIIISILENESFTISTGVGQSATHLHVEDAICMAEHENVSISSADSSALKADMPYDGQSDQVDVSSFQFSFDEAACLNPASVLMALSGFVALLMKNAVQCASPNQP